MPPVTPLLRSRRLGSTGTHTPTPPGRLPCSAASPFPLPPSSRRTARAQGQQLAALVAKQRRLTRRQHAHKISRRERGRRRPRPRAAQGALCVSVSHRVAAALQCACVASGLQARPPPVQKRSGAWRLRGACGVNWTRARQAGADAVRPVQRGPAVNEKHRGQATGLERTRQDATGQDSTWHWRAASCCRRLA